jgi:hypothetical protein
MTDKVWDDRSELEIKYESLLKVVKSAEAKSKFLDIELNDWKAETLKTYALNRLLEKEIEELKVRLDFALETVIELQRELKKQSL